jgi:hypothetical protein
MFEGEWDSNMKQGYGKLTQLDNTIYEGDFLADRKNGKGKIYLFEYLPLT